MRQAITTGAMLTMAGLAFAPAACAVEIEALLGNWTNGTEQYDCKAEPGTETMPVQVEKADAGFYVGALGWGCMVKAPVARGPFIGGQGECGLEGDGESDKATIEIGKTNDGQLVLVRDDGVDIFQPCVPAQ